MRPEGAVIVYVVTSVVQFLWDHAFTMFVVAMLVVVVLQLGQIIIRLGEIEEGVSLLLRVQGLS